MLLKSARTTIRLGPRRTARAIGSRTDPHARLVAGGGDHAALVRVAAATGLPQIGVSRCYGRIERVHIDVKDRRTGTVMGSRFATRRRLITKVTRHGIHKIVLFLCALNGLYAGGKWARMNRVILAMDGTSRRSKV